MDKLDNRFGQQDNRGSQQDSIRREVGKEKALAFVVEAQGERAIGEKYTDIKVCPTIPSRVVEQILALDQKHKKFGVYILQTPDGEHYGYRPDSQGQYTVRVLEPDTFTIMTVQSIIVKSNFIVISQEIVG